MRDRFKLMWLDGEIDPDMPVGSRRTAVKALRDMARRFWAEGERTSGDDQRDLLVTLGAASADEDEEVRDTAASCLREVGAQRAAPLLRQGLASPEGMIRRSSALALAALDEPGWAPQVRGDRDDLPRVGQARVAGALEVLVAALADPEHFDLREQAIKGLGSLGDTEAVPALLPVLEDWKAEVRCAAAEALGALGDERAVIPLVEAVVGEHEPLRASAETALRRLGVPAVAPLIETLRHDSRLVRRRGAQALAVLGGHALEPLLDALQDLSGTVRASVVEALGDLGDDRARTALVARLDDADGDVRTRAVEALAKLTSPDVVEPLVRALADPEGPVRRRAAQALAAHGAPDWQRWVQGYDEDFAVLGEVDQPGVLEVLRRAVSRQSGPARAHAARSLGRHQDAGAIPALIDALRDTDEVVRSAAGAALAKIGDPTVEPLITLFLDRSEPAETVRGEVALALGKLKNHLALGPLLDALDEPSDLVRGRAATALGLLGDPTACPPLRAMLAAPTGSVRRSAALALHDLGETTWRLWVLGDDDDFLRLGRAADSRAVEVLCAVLGRGAPAQQRVDIADSLGRLGGDLAFDTLVSLLTDEAAEVGARAAEALERLGDDRAVGPLLPALVTGSPEVRRAVARALKRLGETQWSAVIHGDDEDLLRLALSGDPRLRDPLARAVEKGGIPDPVLREKVHAALARDGV